MTMTVEDSNNNNNITITPSGAVELAPENTSTDNSNNNSGEDAAMTTAVDEEAFGSKESLEDVDLADVVYPEVVVEDEVAAKCCGGFGDLTMARGYNLLGTARGPIIMSNIFLSTALIYLASEEVGCLVEEDDGKMIVDEDCDERVYGVFSPSALITNIAVISGLLSAFFMPLAGAVIDFTPHRWTTGVISAMLITVIQIIQIGTTSRTWFPMALLQAITGFFYQVQILATFAYLPDIRRRVTTNTMTRFSSTFTMVQFGSQALFLIVIVGISLGLGFNDVRTAQVSQGINSVNIIISFGLAWRLLPKVEARHELEKGKSLLWAGFRQNWNTIKVIQRQYKRSIKWYLLGILFAEPAANAFTLVAVVFLNDKLQMTGTEIGIFFLVVLLAIIPGGLVAKFVTDKSNPSVTFRLAMLLLFVLSVIGAFVLTPDNSIPTYVWGIFVGLMLGTFYPSEKLYLSMICPKGQEAELSGFFVYCTQILGWLPPLIFSLLVEANVDQKYGIICVSSFFLVAIAMISMSASWEDVLEEVRQNDDDNTTTHNKLGGDEDTGAGEETPSDDST